MRTSRTLPILLGALLAAPGAHAQGRGDAPSDSRVVVINRVRLSADQIAAIERQYRVRLVPGSYWYDPMTGAWGVWGGPVAGVVLPGLDLGGRLPADASGGGTGVFFNGRELHPLDVAALRQVSGVVLPGRYWMNAQGWGGYEGQPTFFNLYALAAQAGAARGGGSWIHRGPGGGMGGDGDCVYYIGGDHSASSGC